MNSAEFQLRGLGDPRLAVLAASPLPAWLWSADGSRIRWANPVGAALFGAHNAIALATKSFGPADQHRRQVAQLAGRLPPGEAIRLERLRGFGAPLASLLTCGCARLEFPDGSAGVLVVAAQPVGRGLPLVERLQRLVDGMETPVAAFARDGMFLRASDAARPLLGFRDLSEAGLDDALRNGRVETPIGIGHMVLQRVGSGCDVGLLALIEPGAVHGQAARPQPAAEPRPKSTPESAPEPAEESVSAVAALADPPAENHPPEPSPYVEAVADEPQADPPAQLSPEPPPAAPPEPEPAGLPSWFDEPQLRSRRHPLRFMWQMDADGRFSLGSDEFTRLIGARTAAAFGRLWSDIAETFAIDPEDRVAAAVATRDTWSGIVLHWPADGGARLPVELSGLPIYDRARNFAGYRGFGVCRDLDGLEQLAARRRHEFFSAPPMTGAPAPEPIAARALSAEVAEAAAAADVAPLPDAASAAAAATPPAPSVPETSHVPEPDAAVEPPKNVVPFRPTTDLKSPALTPVENSAFNELARQLSARLDAETSLTTADNRADAAPAHAAEVAFDLSAAPAALRDKTLLDLMPVGVLIYRPDRLLYANPAFLARIGYDSLAALAQEGGLGALHLEPDVASGDTSDGGTPVTISAAASRGAFAPAGARLFSIAWDEEPAAALICSATPAEAIAATPAATAPSPVGHADAEELAAILDTAAEGIVMFDADGHINSCNRSAEALFGYDGDELTRHNLADLFAPESQRVVFDYLDSIRAAGVASLLDHGREALGRVREGGFIPLSLTMGRTRHDGPNFFAVFRDLSQARKTETELLQARRQADRAGTAKADVLARISHEVRTPLNAIIGFAEVMIDQRFGALGNERYVEYMKDIRASGERVIAIVNDMLDLSRIETGKLDLAFISQNLNEVVEQCVAVMQPQANRERIIIRTSLAHLLPTVLADARALRQITLNLIGSSIHLANAGGQVIVSTALSDFGEVVLRVRDTGHGLNDNELAAALEPFRTPPDQASDNAGVSLSLTKALVEANRARFHIKTAPHSGTLIEVVFAHAAAKA